MKLFITRHGQTNMNVNRLVCGTCPAHLTEQGKRQANELARTLKQEQDINKIEYIYVSDLERARQTAAPIEKALGLTAIVDPRLQEVNFGDMEEVSYDDPAFLKRKQEVFYRYPNGESQIEVAHRLFSLIDEVKEERKGHNVLFVSHGSATRLMRSYFLDLTTEQYKQKPMDNCHLICFDL